MKAPKIAKKILKKITRQIMIKSNAASHILDLFSRYRNSDKLSLLQRYVKILMGWNRKLIKRYSDTLYHTE